jgi:hypothetical protein
MSVRNCKRIYVTLTTPGEYITVWQPIFGQANGLETVVLTGLSSKTFMDGAAVHEGETLVEEGVATYVKTPEAGTSVVNGGFTAGTVIEAPNAFAGWRLLVDINGDVGFSTSSALVVGGGI